MVLVLVWLVILVILFSFIYLFWWLGESVFMVLEWVMGMLLIVLLV